MTWGSLPCDLRFRIPCCCSYSLLLCIFEFDVVFWLWTDYLATSSNYCSGEIVVCELVCCLNKSSIYLHDIICLGMLAATSVVANDSIYICMQWVCLRHIFCAIIRATHHHIFTFARIHAVLKKLCCISYKQMPLKQSITYYFHSDMSTSTGHWCWFLASFCLNFGRFGSKIKS